MAAEKVWTHSNSFAKKKKKKCSFVFIFCTFFIRFLFEKWWEKCNISRHVEFVSFNHLINHLRIKCKNVIYHRSNVIKSRAHVLDVLHASQFVYDLFFFFLFCFRFLFVAFFFVIWHWIYIEAIQSKWWMHTHSL